MSARLVATAPPLAPLDLSALADEPLSWRFRAFPADAPDLRFRDVQARRWNALRDLHLPVMTLSRRAVDGNIVALSDYCAQHGVDLAPHTKTPLAPQLFERQRRAGAWAATVATVDHLRVLRAFGMQRAILANEVVDAAGLSWLACETRTHPDLELYLFADSTPAVEALAAALSAAGGSDATRIRVLVEVGHHGGRCGSRTTDAALDVAAAAARSPHMALAGVAGYEGGVGGDTTPETLHAVDDFVGFLRAVAIELDNRGYFVDASEVVISAGGSGFFDRVVAGLNQPWQLSAPVRVVLRCGAYVAHDSGEYQRLSPLDGRADGKPILTDALEIWSAVISRPEEHLAIAGFGKRDAPYDLELPIPFAITRPNGTRRAGALPTVTALNDHHAFLEVPPGCDLTVGDLLGAHIAHPCTAFDKWRAIPLVDDDYSVIDAIRILL